MFNTFSVLRDGRPMPSVSVVDSGKIRELKDFDSRTMEARCPLGYNCFDCPYPKCVSEMTRDERIKYHVTKEKARCK